MPEELDPTVTHVTIPIHPLDAEASNGGMKIDDTAMRWEYLKAIWQLVGELTGVPQDVGRESTLSELRQVYEELSRLLAAARAPL